MKKNLYYHAVFQRKNPVKEFFFNIFTALASWPRLLLEVFLRKNFGERYFSFSTAVIMAFFLALMPVLLNKIFDSYMRQFDSLYDIFIKYLEWYIFIGIFLAVAYFRQKEIDRNPSVFDLGKFSLSSGDTNPLFEKVTIFKNREVAGGPKVGPDQRQIATILEPLVCLIAGLILIKMGAISGALIAICSIFYSFSYMAAFHVGDNFIMDKIDELICNQELYSSFVEGIEPSKTRGVNYYGRRPADPEIRRKVAETFTEQQSETADVF